MPLMSFGWNLFQNCITLKEIIDISWHAEYNVKFDILRNVRGLVLTINNRLKVPEG